MKVNVSIKKSIYDDLEVIAKAQNIPVARLVRQMIEESAFSDTVHALAVEVQFYQNHQNKNESTNNA